MGYGADAICPYLVYESIGAMQRDGKLPASIPLPDLITKYVKGVGVGLLKVRRRGEGRGERPMGAGGQRRQGRKRVSCGGFVAPRQRQRPSMHAQHTSVPAALHGLNPIAPKPRCYCMSPPPLGSDTLKP